MAPSTGIHSNIATWSIMTKTKMITACIAFDINTVICKVQMTKFLQIYSIISLVLINLIITGQISIKSMHSLVSVNVIKLLTIGSAKIRSRIFLYNLQNVSLNSFPWNFLKLVVDSQFYCILGIFCQFSPRLKD